MEVLKYERMVLKDMDKCLGCNLKLTDPIIIQIYNKEKRGVDRCKFAESFYLRVIQQTFQVLLLLYERERPSLCVTSSRFKVQGSHPY